MPSLHGGEGSSLPGLVPSDDTVNSESVLGIKSVDSDVVTGYQVDKFTHTWSVEQFVACPHIILGSLVRYYSFLDQTVANFKQGLDSILTNSLETPELDTSLDETDAITSSVSSGFLHMISTLSENSKSQLSPSIRSCTLLTSPRLLPRGRLIRIYQIFGLVLVLLFMSLDTEQLISHLRVALVDIFPLYMIQREALYLCPKYVNCFSRFMTFWIML